MPDKIHWLSYFTDSITFAVLMGFNRPGMDDEQFVAKRNGKNSFTFYTTRSKPINDTIQTEQFSISQVKKAGFVKVCDD